MAATGPKDVTGASSPSYGELLPWHRASWEVVRSWKTLPQALLITGPEGSGIPLFALAMVQARLCEHPDPDIGIPCGQCRSCEWFAAGHHPDVLRIGGDVATVVEADPEAGEGRQKAAESRDDAAKSRNIPVAEVRRLTSFLQVGAHGAAGRFVVMSPADGMNAAAANALLKILEEPPARTTLVLASAREARLLPTVRSRCQRIRLPRPARDESLRWLATRGIAKAPLALDLAGQAPIAAALLDVEFWSARDRLVGALGRKGVTGSALMTAGEGLPLPVLLPLLQSWVIDCLGVAMTGRVRYHTDQIANVTGAAKRLDLDALMAFEQRLRAARRLVDHPLSPKLVAGELLLAYVACETRS
jgi:DNA polymerase III subunit delta'